MKKIFNPMFFTCMKKYSGGQLVKDIVAGIIVAIIALPLSIALALASGVGPEQGIYTAIIAGFIISFLGGSPVQIAGPTAAFATIVAGIVATSGMPGLATATIMAGIILVIMGIFKFGNLIKFIPTTITTGFTAGIAVTILVGQFKDFFGISYMNGESPIETMEKVQAFGANIGSINWWAVIVGVVCLGIQIVWPKISKKIPGSLIAVIVGVVMVKLCGFGMGGFVAGDNGVKTIGDLFQISNALPSFALPDFSFGMIQSQLGNAFVIAILASIESLLSCVVADGMVGTKHRSNTELIAQGIGNAASALFGGIPATGAIARTAANIKNGGRTPVAGMVHAVVLVLVLIFLMPYAAWIPMPCIASILFMVAYNMCQWRPFVKLCKTAPKSDILVLILTFVLTVVFDLVVAIEVGMIVAVLMFIKRMSEETGIQAWHYKEEPGVEHPEELLNVPKEVRVYEITGPLFFGVAESLAEIHVKDYTKCLVIRMRSVSAIDITSMISLENVYDVCKEHGVKLVLSHVNEQPMKVLKKSGFVQKIGEENLQPNIEAALARAAAIVRE